MRRRRLKLDAKVDEAYYHCISRVVGNAWLLKEREKEVLRRQMWLLAEYCGMEIITYALMSNHYHILIRVPVRRTVSDEELLHNFRMLYPKLKPHQERALQAVEADMAIDGELARAWRRRQLAQMFDVSQFNKLLKMRFSIWYNKTHERFGTLWADRFKNPLVQEGDALRTVGAYVDLNCVRAKMVADPKDYRFCGYAEAVGGNERARRGLCHIYGTGWADTAERYRCMLFGTLADMRELKAPMEPDAFDEFIKSGGKLSLQEIMRCRVRYFVDGVVLGSEAFVREKSQLLSPTKERSPQPLKAITDWGGLHVLSRMRGSMWG